MKPLIVFVASLVLAATLAQAEPLRIGTEGAFPPFNFVNDKGEVDGFERELGDELCRRAGLSCEWLTGKWADLIPALADSRYDAVMSGLSITAEREKTVVFSQSYVPPPISVYVGLSATANLKSGPVAVQAGTIQADFAAHLGAKVMPFATAEQALAAVRAKKAAVVLADRDYIAPVVAQADSGLSLVGDPISIGGGIGIAMRPTDTKLRTAFDGAIQAMKDDGTLNAMIRKWFGDAAPTF